MRYLIAYDLMQPGQNYAALWKALADMGAVRVLESAWIVRSRLSAVDLANYCLRYMDPNDRLFVSEVTNNFAFRGTLVDPNTL